MHSACYVHDVPMPIRSPQNPRVQALLTPQSISQTARPTNTSRSRCIGCLPFSLAYHLHALRPAAVSEVRRGVERTAGNFANTNPIVYLSFSIAMSFALYTYLEFRN